MKASGSGVLLAEPRAKEPAYACEIELRLDRKTFKAFLLPLSALFLSWRLVVLTEGDYSGSVLYAV